MKKVVIVFFVLMFVSLMCTKVQAQQMYPYQNVQSGQALTGSSYSKGNTDYYMMPAKTPVEFFNSSSVKKGGMPFNARSLYLGASALPRLAGGFHSDPYIITVKNIKYVMIKDNHDGVWNENDILGYTDPKDNLFLSLRNLECDSNPSTITSKELKNQGIRLVAMDSKGVLQINNKSKDFNLNNIDYIDMSSLRKISNSDKTGIFGHFNVYLKTKDPNLKLVVGYVTFDTNSNLGKLFP